MSRWRDEVGKGFEEGSSVGAAADPAGSSALCDCWSGAQQGRRRRRSGGGDVTTKWGPIAARRGKGPKAPECRRTAVCSQTFTELLHLRRMRGSIEARDPFEARDTGHAARPFALHAARELAKAVPERLGASCKAPGQLARDASARLTRRHCSSLSTP